MVRYVRKYCKRCKVELSIKNRKCKFCNTKNLIYRVVVPFPYNGKYIRKTKVCRTLKEANVILNEFLRERLRNNVSFFLKKDKINLKDFVEKIFYPYLKKEKPKTFKAYYYVIQNHILPYFGNYYVDEIKEKDVNKFRIELSNKLAPSTLIKIFTYFRVLLNFADEEGFINKEYWRNPVDKVKKKIKKVDNTRTAFLGVKDVDIIVKKAIKMGDKLIARITLLAFYTGLRASEIANLRWNNLHFNAEDDLSILLEKEKTNSGKPIFLPREEKILKFIFGENYRKNIGKDEKIFNITRSTISVKFKKVIDALGWNKGRNNKTKIVFHTLRHSFTTVFGNKMPPTHLQDIARHKDFTTTQRYLHFNLEEIKENYQKAAQEIIKNSNILDIYDKIF